MENVSLVIRIDQIPELFEAVKAYNSSISSDPNSTTERKAAVSDLAKRCQLLHKAAIAETQAKQMRQALHSFCHRKEQQEQHD